MVPQARPKRIDYHAIAARHPDLSDRMMIRDSGEFYQRCADPDGYAEGGWVPKATIDELKRREALAGRPIL